MMAGKLVIACDLGTGGNKAALYDVDGTCQAETTVEYQTHYPRPDYHEQRPEDWYDAVVRSIQALLAAAPGRRNDIAAIAISGQSLGCLPLDAVYQPLQARTPIWSDGRARREADEFFAKISETDWYMRTGNGFPPPLYPVFKAMWLRRHEAAVFDRTRHLVGSKDYVNLRLTGRLATDHSYASGSGIYDLATRRYDPGLLDAAGLEAALFPSPVSSTEVIGTLTAAAARDLDLPQAVQVIAGGVDNSCMALGARNTSEGSIYNALGSSSWLTVTSARPLLDPETRPFVFAHVLPGFFNSAMSTFSTGTSLKWVRDQFYSDLTYEQFFALAATSPPGANGLLFVPTLAGGTMAEGGPSTRGGFVGLDLSHTRADIARATLEGIAFGLRVALDRLCAMTEVGTEMIVVGGGAQNVHWRQIYADIYGLSLIRTGIDRTAAALGAAAIGFMGTGLWSDMSLLESAHVERDMAIPDPARHRTYEALLPAYRGAAQMMAKLGRQLTSAREN